MTYNVLDLPLSYTKGNTQVEWKYSAEGVKLQEKTTVTSQGSSVTTVDHIGDFVFKDGALTRVDFAGGFADMTGSSPALFFLTDHLGSVRVVADAQGNVHQVNHYYPYGDRFVDPRYTVTAQGAGSDNGILFAGKEQERTSGLYDFEARFDNTFLGRFTTMDPMAEKYYSISPYAYCAGNPVNLIDPDGEDIWDKLIGFIVGCLTNIIPGSGFVRDWYAPNSSSDYNNALQSVDHAAEVVGDATLTVAAVEGGTGAAMAATGSGLAVSVVGAPEGAVVAGTGAAIMAQSAELSATGALIKANSKVNQAGGYERGEPTM